MRPRYACKHSLEISTGQFITNMLDFRGKSKFYETSDVTPVCNSMRFEISQKINIDLQAALCTCIDLHSVCKYISMEQGP